MSDVASTVVCSATVAVSAIVFASVVVVAILTSFAVLKCGIQEMLSVYHYTTAALAEYSQRGADT